MILRREIPGSEDQWSKAFQKMMSRRTKPKRRWPRICQLTSAVPVLVFRDYEEISTSSSSCQWPGNRKLCTNSQRNSGAQKCLFVAIGQSFTFHDVILLAAGGKASIRIPSWSTSNRRISAIEWLRVIVLWFFRKFCFYFWRIVCGHMKFFDTAIDNIYCKEHYIFCWEFS